MSILALGVFACHAGEKIQFSAPRKPTSTSSTDAYRRLLEEDLKKGGSRPAADPMAAIQSANVSTMTTSPKGDEKRLRELLDRKKNWIFMDPDSFGKPPKSDSLFGESTEDLESSSFGADEDTSLIGRFLSGDSKGKGRKTSKENRDSEKPGSNDPFGSFSSDRPLFEALESALGNEPEPSLGDSFGFNTTQPKKGWEVLFGSKLDSDAGSKKSGLFDPNRIEMDQINREFADKMFSGTSFLGDIGTDRTFDADKEFNSLINPGLSKIEGLGGGLINQTTDPGRNALNPVVGQGATESIRFSESLNDFPVRTSRMSPTVGGEFMRRELPVTGSASIAAPAAAESRQSQGVPRLPTVFEIPRRGF